MTIVAPGDGSGVRLLDPPAGLRIPGGGRSPGPAPGGGGVGGGGAEGGVVGGGLGLLDPPAVLRIPVGARSPVPAPVGVAIGEVVAKGQLLADAKVEGGAAALAPTSGRITGVVDVTLTNGQVVPAVELEAD